MSTPAPTLTADQVEALTGITDRRLRQLAKAGYFPPPTNGKYQQAATIRGLFKYYREDYHSAAKSLNDIKAAKLRAETEMAQIKLSEARGDVIGRDFVGNFLRDWSAKLDMLLTSELEVNLPPKLLGETMAEMRVTLRRSHDTIREATARGLVQWRNEVARRARNAVEGAPSMLVDTPDTDPDEGADDDELDEGENNGQGEDAE